MDVMQALVDAGLGLAYGTLRLVRVREEWPAIGLDLAATVATTLGPLVADVEPVGSTSVPGLVAKPIIDIAIGLRPGTDHRAVEHQLADDGWIYRGDAGESGGHLFMLESEPWVRVAHAHGVPHLGSQWNRYMRFRDLLRSDEDARTAYSNTKLALLEDLDGEDVRSRYTDQKGPVVDALLRRATS